MSLSTRAAAAIPAEKMEPFATKDYICGFDEDRCRLLISMHSPQKNYSIKLTRSQVDHLVITAKSMQKLDGPRIKGIPTSNILESTLLTILQKVIEDQEPQDITTLLDENPCLARKLIRPKQEESTQTAKKAKTAENKSVSFKTSVDKPSPELFATQDYICCYDDNATQLWFYMVKNNKRYGVSMARSEVALLVDTVKHLETKGEDKKYHIESLKGCLYTVLQKRLEHGESLSLKVLLDENDCLARNLIREGQKCAAVKLTHKTVTLFNRLPAASSSAAAAAALPAAACENKARSSADKKRYHH